MTQDEVRKTARWPRVTALVVATIVVVLALCEAAGWPFLAAPLQRWLGETLDRRVSLSVEPGAKPQATIHLLGGVSLAAAHIELGAPAWSKEPHMVLARDAEIRVGYGDLWRASRGEPIHIRSLRAREFDTRLERLSDGRASWKFKDKPDQEKTPDESPAIPSFGRLIVDSGTAIYRDAVLPAEVDARFSLREGSAVASNSVARSGDSLSGAASGAVAGANASIDPAVTTAAAVSVPGLQLQATGTFQKNRLDVKLETSGVLPVMGADAETKALPVVLDAKIGRAVMTFRGTATDPLHFTALQGRFSVRGPSLASVGDPMKVTLPTTGPFQTEGVVAKDGLVWNVVFDRTTIGASRLTGAFQYDPRPRVPTLSGRLSGSKLLLADLGPTVGTEPAPAAAASTASAASSPSARTSRPAGARSSRTAASRPPEGKPARVLPDREFDLPSLRAMNANVLIAIDHLDLGTTVLEPLKPLRAYLMLTDGVLSVRDIEARTGQGRLAGSLQLDGRQPVAVWNADLRWDGVRLENWIKQTRSDDAPPYITGRLSGQARVTGQGKSTAAILGSLRGGVRLRIADGTVSHLVVEATGLDLAQGLGMLFKGDDALKLQCTVADFTADKGVLRPRAFVVDTVDSLVLVVGTMSLASEAMDLKVTALPKDFSPFALRTPVLLRGTFGDPSVSLDVGRLAPRVGAAAVLALLSPIAAILPMIDFGENDEAKKGADACRALSTRIATRPDLPPPAAAKALPASSR